MAFASINPATNPQIAWYLANRNGGLPSGTPGSALVSDLLANDYLVGSRCKIVSIGATTAGVTTLNVTRNGINFAVGQLAASTVIIIR